MNSNKQSKKPLSELVFIERVKGRTPLMSVLLDIVERLTGGEREDSAVQLVSEHGLPSMMGDLEKEGLLKDLHWRTWRDRMTSVDAEMILAMDEAKTWPHEVREWASVIAVSAL